MTKHNQVGAISGLLVSFIMTVLLLCGAIGFAVWAYGGRQDYKNNVDQKISVATDKAKQQESDRKDAEFAETVKNPLKTYNGPEDYGSLLVAYPKTWSGYVSDKGTGGQGLVDGYFAPGTVPSVSDQNSVFALRIQVVSQQYSQVLQSLASQQQQGKLTVNTYALPKVPKIVGIQVNGQLSSSGDRNVTMVVLPLRSQTLKIWTEGNQYLDDFNNYILPNFSFSP